MSTVAIGQYTALMGYSSSNSNLPKTFSFSFRYSPILPPAPNFRITIPRDAGHALPDQNLLKGPSILSGA